MSGDGRLMEHFIIGTQPWFQRECWQLECVTKHVKSDLILQMNAEEYTWKRGMITSRVLTIGPSPQESAKQSIDKFGYCFFFFCGVSQSLCTSELCWWDTGTFTLSRSRDPLCYVPMSRRTVSRSDDDPYAFCQAKWSPCLYLSPSLSISTLPNPSPICHFSITRLNINVRQKF